MKTRFFSAIAVALAAPALAMIVVLGVALLRLLTTFPLALMVWWAWGLVADGIDGVERVGYWPVYGICFLTSILISALKPSDVGRGD